MTEKNINPDDALWFTVEDYVTGEVYASEVPGELEFDSDTGHLKIRLNSSY